MFALFVQSDVFICFSIVYLSSGFLGSVSVCTGVLAVAAAPPGDPPAGWASARTPARMSSSAAMYTQLAAVMETLVHAAVAELKKLLEDKPGFRRSGEHEDERTRADMVRSYPCCVEFGFLLEQRRLLRVS